MAPINIFNRNDSNQFFGDFAKKFQEIQAIYLCLPELSEKSEYEEEFSRRLDQSICKLIKNNELGINSLFEMSKKINWNKEDNPELFTIEQIARRIDDAFKPFKVQGVCEFNDVSFSYDGEKAALENFTLSVKAGESVALVGPSGAGKTTLANLLPRFYDVTGGSITIDGYNVKDVTFKSLREQIGLVPQETVLFNATIKENILYGRLDATDEDVYEAAKAANVLEFVEKMPDGLDTIVGERGSSLSGGQRQRVAIARAILKDPRILILDEATSALDTESEKLVQEALDRLMKGRTAFVIAHRLSTVQNAHQIVVLNQGRLVEQGTHQELLAVDGGLYNHLYSVQFSNKG